MQNLLYKEHCSSYGSDTVTDLAHVMQLEWKAAAERFMSGLDESSNMTENSVHSSAIISGHCTEHAA